MITVVCPIYNEEKYIARCIESIMEQDYPKSDMEVLFVDGMSTDHTRAIIEEYLPRCPYLRVIDNPQRIVPYAMNAGIKAAKGDVIIRLDAHALYPSNYFSELVRKLYELNADNVGAVCRTLPANDTPKCKAIAAALSSAFGMGNSYFRIGAKEIKQVDTVPFGCYRKDVFDRIGPYDNDLVRNQDDELNARLIKHGGKIYLIPYIVVDYFARDTIKKTGKMFYQYGLYKPLVNKKLGSPATVRQFFPVDQGAWLYIAEIDPDQPWKLISDPVLLSMPEYGWANNHTFVDEGPFALLGKEKIFLTFSSAAVDSTYVVGLLSADLSADLLDPASWTKENYPLMSSRSREGEFGTGHNSYITDEDGLVWNAYHARPGIDGPRSAGLRRVHFGPDGYPVLDLTEELDLSPELVWVSARVIVK